MCAGDELELERAELLVDDLPNNLVGRHYLDLQCRQDLGSSSSTRSLWMADGGGWKVFLREIYFLELFERHSAAESQLVLARRLSQHPTSCSSPPQPI